MSSSLSEPIPTDSIAKPRTRLLLRGLLPVLIVTTALGLFIAGWRPTDAITVAARLGPAAPVAFLFVGALMMSMLVPKTIVSLSAGALFGIPLGALTLSITAVVAAAVNFSIGRWWLGDWVAGRQGQRWTVARGLADDATFFTHLLFRLSPVPTSAISYSMGAANARVKPFLLAAAVGSIPQWMWVWCGAATNAAMQSSSTEQTNTSGWIGVLISATAAIGLAGILPQLASKQIRDLERRSKAEPGRTPTLHPEPSSQA